MSKNYTINVAEKNDFDQLVKLEQVCFPDKADRFSPTQIYYLLNRSKHEALVAKEDGQILGWVLTLIRKHQKTYSARIYTINVHPKSRGKGIAFELMTQMLQKLSSYPIKNVYLEVKETNQGAIKLYETFGFVKTGLIKNYYDKNVNAYKMVLNLSYCATHLHNSITAPSLT